MCYRANTKNLSFLRIAIRDSQERMYFNMVFSLFASARSLLDNQFVLMCVHTLLIFYFDVAPNTW